MPSPPSPMSVSETVWYEEADRSPSPPAPNGLVFRPVAAQSGSGPTVALLSAYHLGSPFLEYYGGQLPRAIWVVAINLDTGLVYHADLSDPDHPPIVLEAADHEIDMASPGWSTESGLFNLDLCRLLGLPEPGSAYRLFLWLDDLPSNSETTDIPANPARGSGRPSAAKAVTPNSFSPSTIAAGLKPGSVVLSPSKDSNSDAVTVHWYPAPAGGPGHTGLWLLAWSHRDRHFEWTGIASDQLGSIQGPVAFEISFSELLSPTGIKQKGFLIGVSSTGISNVLTQPMP